MGCSIEGPRRSNLRSVVNVVDYHFPQNALCRPEVAPVRLPWHWQIRIVESFQATSQDRMSIVEVRTHSVKSLGYVQVGPAPAQPAFTERVFHIHDFASRHVGDFVLDRRGCIGQLRVKCLQVFAIVRGKEVGECQRAKRRPPMILVSS